MDPDAIIAEMKQPLTPEMQLRIALRLIEQYARAMTVPGFQEGSKETVVALRCAMREISALAGSSL